MKLVILILIDENFARLSFINLSSRIQFVKPLVYKVFLIYESILNN